MKEELIFTVTPQFTKGEIRDPKCICCPKEHIYSYNSVPDYGGMLYGIIRTEMYNADDVYKERKFRITIEEIEEEDEE